MQAASQNIIATNLHQNNSLLDTYGRKFTYLRISVIEQCNLRCIYCMPEEGIDFTPNHKLLTLQEIIRIIKVISPLGVNKIRYTGGEPLLRRDLIELVQETAKINAINSVHLTTNGLLLHKKAEALKKAGLSGLNISMDTFDADKFLKISRRQGVDLVLSNLKQALKLDFASVKINMVVMRGFNEDEIKIFAELTRNFNITVRFIELMPFDAHQIWKTGHFYGSELILEQLHTLYSHLEKVEGSSTEEHIYKIKNYRGKIAVIPSYTRSLCGSCNRIRLTADGRIRNCLYSDDEFNLLRLMRSGGSNDDIALYFKKAMWEKEIDGWAAQKKADSKASTQHRDSMTQIGG